MPGRKVEGIGFQGGKSRKRDDEREEKKPKKTGCRGVRPKRGGKPRNKTGPFSEQVTTERMVRNLTTWERQKREQCLKVNIRRNACTEDEGHLCQKC